METIYKYPLQVTDRQDIPIPAGGSILTVQVQNDVPCLWAKVDSSHVVLGGRTIMTYGTGQPITEPNIRYIGTYQLRDGALVFHVYELTDITDLPY